MSPGLRPSPQGQESERESLGGVSEARLANMPAGGLITLSTLLLSALLFQQHYSLTWPCLPGNYTAELVLPEGETVHSTQPRHSPHKMWIYHMIAKEEEKHTPTGLKIQTERTQPGH